jgi:hypothetical protein
MSRLSTENVLTNVADRLGYAHYEHLHTEARALQLRLRREWLYPARLPVGQGLGVDAGPDKAEAPGMDPQGFTAPRSKATGYEDGCYTDCA